MPRLPWKFPDAETFFLDICLTARINFFQAWTPARRHALIECLRDYAELCGEHLYLQGSPVSSQVVRYKPTIFDRLHTFIDSKNREQEDLQVGLYGGRKSVRTPTNYRIRFTANCHADEEKFLGDTAGPVSSALFFRVPWFWHASAPKTGFTDLVWRFADRLQADSGYAGLGFSTYGGYSDRHSFEFLINRMIWRWPPFILDDGIFDAKYLRFGVREPAWITLLGDGFLSRLGGVDPVCGQLTPPIATRRYNGGLFIQAGPEPDPNMPSIYQPPPPGLYDDKIPGVETPPFGQQTPQFKISDYPLYCQVNEVIKPIRVTPEIYPKTWQSPRNWYTRRPSNPKSIDLPPPADDTWLTSENIHRWIARFDTPSPWESDPPLRVYVCDDLFWLASSDI